MSKFCGNCGSSMEDNARVCGNCGTPCVSDGANGVAVNPSISGVTTMSDEQKKKITTIAVIAGAGVAVVIVLIIAINIISSFTGYKGTLNKYFNAVEDYDVEQLMEITSDALYSSDYYDEDETQDYKEERLDYFAENSLDTIENKVGDNVKLSYEIKDTSVYSERKFDNFIEDLEVYSDYDTSDITKVMEVSLTVKAKGSDGKKNYYPSDYILVKENGKWLVFSGYIVD